MSLKTQNYILLIFNCYKYREKALLQKKTWLPGLPQSILYFHVLGDPDLESDFVINEEENLLIVKCKDDYVSLPSKVIQAYEAMFETYQFKYIFKTDDDQHLKKTKFFEVIMNILEQKTPKIHYGGHIVDVQVPYLSEYHRIHPELPQYLVIQKTKYCSGRFYLLSWDSIFNLCNKKTKIQQEVLEDYSIGFHLSSFLKDTIFNIKVGDSFEDQVVSISSI